MNQAHIDNTGASRGSLNAYVTGFVLSVVLTVISFTFVMVGKLPTAAVLIGILSAAAVQMLVHIRYFLHLDTSSALRWNLMALIFAVLIMVLFVGGTIWIMWHLNTRLML
ncbi:MAG: cytochrome o ubiquinol oxidase subunit IV [Desulfobacterales bacterium]|jgi:cytochrome o ubiquinol oxidase operon protein cyoD